VSCWFNHVRNYQVCSNRYE